jgi:hypothetical protein
MSTIRFLIPILCLLVLLVAIALSSASQLPWRTIDSIPTYNLGSLDPRPPKGYEQEWLKRVNHIYTVAHMYFYEDWKGRKPIFNYYIVSQCPDEETNEIYRETIRRAINDIMRYRDKFVELYPQFSYLLKLKLQLSDGPLYDSVFNIPIYVPSVCNESGLSVTSYAYYFEKII